MDRRIGRAAAGALAAAVLSVLVGVSAAAPAQADCVRQWKNTALNPANSETFNASIGCDGLWGIQSTTEVERVRGQYYVDGEWRYSATYSWRTFSSSDSEAKLIGNTVDGRRLRGETYWNRQDIRYRF
ncbi:hypothetical protein GUY44_22330 [Pimelobacter simplex]|uniref:hypothetical protein n=1 Tax=Nocardioides simplex TaxID=2045 RepID=UPI000535F4F8|nr:hypothetical protein [Pimelobacter simplex]MCG8153236.1 hypothetical protein [Pimelobacter simplex]GEB14226.1 hypothetical protein NSI01_25410 [Pimelobacter simplex]SFM32171.1 hypothetical protein SAMN05421671_1193 [Pimelobacter simplex]